MSRISTDSHRNTIAVQATNDDASASKLSCVKKGYMKDDYIHLFVKKAVRRSPMINRGYYARWAALPNLLLEFLERDIRSGNDTPVKKQILSLGAGFDTTYFQLVDEGIAPHLYVELDFKEVTSKKTALIDRHSRLRNKVGEEASVSIESGEVLSDHYKLLPIDLRDVNQLEAILSAGQLDSSLPTFIIAECVLINLDPDSTRNIVRWASKTFSTAVFFLYEQILPDDAFGEQMMRNLERAVAWDMLKIYNDFIETEDKRRIERLELFDEFEEWYMMQEHYCVAYAINDAKEHFRNSEFPEKQDVALSIR